VGLRLLWADLVGLRTLQNLISPANEPNIRQTKKGAPLLAKLTKLTVPYEVPYERAKKAKKGVPTDMPIYVEELAPINIGAIGGF